MKLKTERPFGIEETEIYYEDSEQIESEADEERNLRENNESGFRDDLAGPDTTPIANRNLRENNESEFGDDLTEPDTTPIANVNRNKTLNEDSQSGGLREPDPSPINRRNYENSNQSLESDLG